MNDTKIQIRISEKLKTKFTNAVEKKGLDLSSAIRIMMIEFTNGNLDIGIKTKLDEEIAKGKKNYQEGNFIQAKTKEDIATLLN